MFIAGIASDVTATNCWIVAPGPGEQCLVIDPGIGVQGQLDELISENALHPVAVLLTHGHFDHTFSVLPVCQARDVPAYIHQEDRSALADPWTFHGLRPGEPIFGAAGLTFAEPGDVRELRDNATLELAGLMLSVRHAPGHTRGSVVFTLDPGAGMGADQTGEDRDVLFSGDVLFAGSIGRVDLPGGSMADMSRSLQTVILPMADEVIVCPGHGPQTTIGRERMTNPFLRNLM